jgi:hypothetical protein
MKTNITDLILCLIKANQAQQHKKYTDAQKEYLRGQAHILCEILKIETDKDFSGCATKRQAGEILFKELSLDES